MPAPSLSWVCCGVDYPHLLDDDVDVILYGRAKPWDHAPGSLLLQEAGAWVGHADGTDYDARLDHRGGLVAAADRATYDEVVAALGHDAV